MKSIGLIWAQYGPYHRARAAAFQKHAGTGVVHAIELANQTALYEWTEQADDLKVITLCPGSVTENLGFFHVFRQARRVFTELKLEVCLLPSYWPKQSLAVLLAAQSLGIKVVMMNETHAGTVRAGGYRAAIKQQLVKRFDAAFVGGAPQCRYFTSLGIPAEKIFIGYDAVDNDYFVAQAEAVRNRTAEVRKQYELPEHYFLSLGRFVEKKNLVTLIRAYHKFLAASPENRTHLVLVGSGEDEAKLRAVCNELKLPVYEKKHAGKETRNAASNKAPGVHFYGFRQIEENPLFYALADAFVLPSLWEEWGLVVNEAMACGLPVIVSNTAGCAEDLLKPGQPEPLAIPEHLKQWPQLNRFIRQNGFAFDPRSDESLAMALQILAASQPLREAMGAAGRKHVENYSCETFGRNALLAARAARGESITTGFYLTEGQPLIENP